MKATLCCVVVLFGSIVLVARAKDPATEGAAAAPLGGFLKVGEKVILVEQKEKPGIAVRIVSADDMEMVRKVRASEEPIRFVEEKELAESLDKAAKDNPIAGMFVALGFFDADELNGLINLALKQVKICSVVAVDPGYVIVKFDDPPAKEALIPIQQIRRIERASILDER